MQEEKLYLTTEEQALAYNKYRPIPPEELINKILDFLKEKFQDVLETAVDVGCGSGQSTAVLAPYFKRVIGIDNCPMQISQAEDRNIFDNVKYRSGTSHNFDLPDKSVHLVTAGQSAHFFEMPKFYSEVDRVLLPGGVLAIYGYSLPIPSCDGVSLEDIILKMYKTTMYPYINENHVYVHNYNNEDFRTFPFTDQPLIRYEFYREIKEATVEDLIGYARSWSAFQKLRNCQGDSAACETMKSFQNEIMAFLHKEDENPEEVNITIKFPYILLMGRKN